MMGSARAETRLETDRLVLRAPRLEDAPRVVDIINDIDIARMTTGIPHPYRLDEAEAFYAQLTSVRTVRDVTLQMETRDGQVVGAVGAHLRDAPFPELGYWLGRGYWGRGYATEAVLAMRDWAIKAFACRALIAGHFIDNDASGRVLIKCGFLYTGEVQERFSVARGETAATRMMVWLA